jgi:hypothetical protein
LTTIEIMELASTACAGGFPPRSGVIPVTKAWH